MDWYGTVLLPAVEHWGYLSRENQLKGQLQSVEIEKYFTLFGGFFSFLKKKNQNKTKKTTLKCIESKKRNKLIQNYQRSVIFKDWMGNLPQNLLKNSRYNLKSSK